MFRVDVTIALDEGWEERDAELLRLAGQKSYSSEATCDKGQQGIQQRCWLVSDFTSARELKERLAQVEGVVVTMGEHYAETRKINA